MGEMGACRANEMNTTTVDNLQALESAFVVTLPNTKTKLTHKFTSTDSYY